MLFYGLSLWNRFLCTTRWMSRKFSVLFTFEWTILIFFGWGDDGLFCWDDSCLVSTLYRSFKLVLSVLAHADLILLLLHLQYTVHRFGGSPTCSGCSSQCILMTSWIAIPLFPRTCSINQIAFSSVLFLDGCPKHLAPLTDVTPVFNVDTHLETFVLPIYLLSKSYFQHLKVCMLFPSSFKYTLF